jgi:hypothetical protein
VRSFSMISPMFWTGDTGRSLRRDPLAQLIALYLITAPTSHSTGVYYLPVAYISNDTGIPLQGASKGLARLLEGGFCHYDRDAEWVWVCEMAIWQIGKPTSAGDNRIVGVRKYFADLPNLLFLPAFFDKYAKIYGLAERPAAPQRPSPKGSPSEGACKPPRSTDTDTDTDTDTINPLSGLWSAVEFERLKAAYPRRDGHQRWSDAEKAIRARLRERHTWEEIHAGVARYAAYCVAKEQIGTKYVQQAGTFFGKNKGFAETWEPPAPAAARPPRATRYEEVMKGLKAGTAHE